MRVSDTIALTLIFLCVFAVGGIALLVDESTSWWAGPYCLISFICFVALLILFWVVITPLRYIRWSYALSKEFLDIMRGIIVRKHTENVDLDPFRKYLNSIGDSLVIGEDDEAFKVHVHTNIPGEALTEAQKYGTLELAKIENMRTQADDLAAGKHVQSTDDLEEDDHDHCAAPASAAPEKKYGFVSVCAGDGLADVFRDLGVDRVVSGGQTMNPSTKDLLDAAGQVNADASSSCPTTRTSSWPPRAPASWPRRRAPWFPREACPRRSPPCSVSTRRQPRRERRVDDRAYADVKTGEVTVAIKDSKDAHDNPIKEGDVIGIADGSIEAVDDSIDGAVLTLLGKMEAEDADYMIVEPNVREHRSIS